MLAIHACAPLLQADVLVLPTLSDFAGATYAPPKSRSESNPALPAIPKTPKKPIESDEETLSPVAEASEEKPRSVQGYLGNVGANMDMIVVHLVIGHCSRISFSRYCCVVWSVRSRPRQSQSPRRRQRTQKQLQTRRSPSKTPSLCPRPRLPHTSPRSPRSRGRVNG